MATVTATLAEFLLARIAEDEAAARFAADGPWTDTGPVLAGVVGVAGHDTVAVCNSDEWGGGEYTYPASPEEAANSVHIARWDPVRVLAECDAKRRIVEGWGQWETYNGEELLQVLALPYADHPDYRDEWRP